MLARRFLRTTTATALVVGGLLVGGSTAAVATDDATAPAEAVVEPADVATDLATDERDADQGGTAKEAPRSLRAAYSGLTITPAGPYAGGETVTVKGTGFEPNEQVVLSICLGDQKLAGPQDCAPLNGSSSAIGAANGSGVASLQIKVIKGTLGAQSKPAHSCGNGAGESCVFSLTNFGGDGPAAVRVKYKAVDTATGGSTTTTDKKSKKSKKSTSAASDDSGSDDTSDTAATSGGDSGTASGGAEIAATGAGSAMTTLAWGLALLLLGAVLTVSGRVWTPRTTNED